MRRLHPYLTVALLLVACLDQVRIYHLRRTVDSISSSLDVARLKASMAEKRLSQCQQRYNKTP